MSILITRPLPAGEELAKRLRSMGKSAFSAPLIDIQPGADLPLLSQKLQWLSAGDLVFLLSKNAVHYAHKQLMQEGQSWPNQLSYYGIGKSTSLMFHRLTGLDIFCSGQGETSEDLLQLPALQKMDNKKILLLRGNGGREVIASTLRFRGGEVDYCECYARRPVNYDAANFSRHWRQCDIKTLVVTSGEMLQLLYNLVTDSDGKAWLLNCKLIVVSERLADIAHTLGWQTIKVAKSADNDALIQALE
ncbi:uroporphyrinogen-III synthase [Xenorhabdus sp. DI]|uniref:uroporphyrinogen-III synthase n=1 Tax=Xenorhabdus doucetiae TaxID=351671 RepID=UPI0019A262F9|nr:MULTISPECIES: uroporphyrinogen-III synthase [unclassified Xenorhabdus]MBD2783177.1 uroporphyrinogen-III synthase [Xenorhabdus sp. 3]MBD2787974.1 uroporphyrinogen-III synthase [Xenorhabdus sp. DI]MBD2794995.1 uroporphyrinogen-III synthase [Xenorhabdus sp. 18]